MIAQSRLQLTGMDGRKANTCCHLAGINLGDTTAKLLHCCCLMQLGHKQDLCSWICWWPKAAASLRSCPAPGGTHLHGPHQPLNRHADRTSSQYRASTRQLDVR